MKKVVASLAAVAAVVFLANSASATRVDNPITICHATASFTNPYVEITVDTSSTAFAGHEGHTGPIFDGVDKGWGDIIPPTSDDGTINVTPLNWPSGQSILDNGCVPSQESPPPCEEDCPSSPPPTTPPPTGPSAFVFSSCTDTFVRIVNGPTNLAIMVDGVETDYTAATGDIDLGQLANGTVVEVIGPFSTVFFTVANTNCSTTPPTVPPSHPPFHPTFTPTWTPSQPLPAVLAFTGANVTKPALALGFLFLTGMGALWWARRRSLAK